MLPGAEPQEPRRFARMPDGEAALLQLGDLADEGVQAALARPPRGPPCDECTGARAARQRTHLSRRLVAGCRRAAPGALTARVRPRLRVLCSDTG